MRKPQPEKQKRQPVKAGASACFYWCACRNRTLIYPIDLYVFLFLYLICTNKYTIIYLRSFFDIECCFFTKVNLKQPTMLFFADYEWYQ